jgi:hypothetical protein
LSLNQLQLEISPIALSILIAAIIIPIILTVAMILRTKKQKKPLAFTVMYGNQLLSIKGMAQREPLRDRSGSRNSGVIHFCNRISLTIKNEGTSEIDTDVCESPLDISLDIKGELDGLNNLKPNPVSNPGLSLSVNDGLLVVEHIHIKAGASLEISFLGYFKVNLVDLY